MMEGEKRKEKSRYEEGKKNLAFCWDDGASVTGLSAEYFAAPCSGITRLLLHPNKPNAIALHFTPETGPKRALD